MPVTHTWLDPLLAGRPLNRTPRALWRHFPLEEFDTRAFVAATVQFQREHRFDLVKITPRSSFGIRDFGCRDEPSGDALGRPRYLGKVIRDPSDWERLMPLEPSRGALAQQVACIQGIRAALGTSVPIVQTVFCPLTQARNLAGLERLIQHGRLEPQALTRGLEVLAESSIRFIEQIRPWVDGICYVIQDAGLEALPGSGYHALCGDLDRAVLSAHQGPANMLHLHGPILEFERFCRYPVSILHWDEGAAGISMLEGKRLFPGVVSGGIDWPIEGWSGEEALEQACRATVARVGGDRFLLAAGCVIPYLTPPRMLDLFTGVAC